jgi:hypothetical protein
MMSRPFKNAPYCVPSLNGVDKQDITTSLIDHIYVEGAEKLSTKDHSRNLLLQVKQLVGAVNSIRNGCQDPVIKKQLTRALLATGWTVGDDE